MASFIAVSSQLNPVPASNTQTAMVSLALPVRAKVQTISEVIETKAKAAGINPELAIKIASCESSLRQYNVNGSVLRGERNPSDLGLFQINRLYHDKESQNLGYNIHTTEGNIDYAMHLLKTDGSSHWNYSKTCWDAK